MNRDRRALILGAVVILSAWIFLRGLSAAGTALRTREEGLVQRLDLLARSRATMATLPRLDDSVRAFNEVASTLPQVLLVGPDAGTAAVHLMQKTRDLVALRPATITGFEAGRTDDESGPLALAVVHVTIETDFVELLDMIAHVEQDPALAIESFDIRASDPHADPTMPERITAELAISGWYRRDTESPKPNARPTLAAAR